MPTQRMLLRRAGLATGSILVVAVGAWSLGFGLGQSTAGTRPGESLPSRPARADVREADIAFWSARVARDTLGAEDRSRLAALYFERAATTGYQDHVRAERMARASLAIRRVRNGKAAALLANALLAQHRFDEAYRVVTELDSLEPGVIAYRALRGEVALETGRYQVADSLFELVRRQGSPSPSVVARIARWRELSGEPQLAEELIGRALRAVMSGANTRPEDGAWFHLRLADIAMRRGDAATAKIQLDLGLEGAPDDRRLLDARARLALLRGDWNEAIALGRRSMAAVPEPDVLALMSDAYAGNGDVARALATADAMRRLALADTGPWHRSWTMFLLDHGMEVPAMLERAVAELETRRDVYGYAVHAWALYVSGDQQRAFMAARTSLGRGVRDAELYFRAGAIAIAAGQTEEGERYQAIGRRINPRYRPRWERTIAMSGATSRQAQVIVEPHHLSR